VRTRRLLAVLATVTIVVTIGAWLSLRPTKTAELRYEGRSFQLPLPTWSTRLPADQGSARYLVVGDPVFGQPLGEFQYVEQLGSGHLLVSDELRLLIVTSKRTRWLTEIYLRIERRPGSR
jgi:hypothetical protein